MDASIGVSEKNFPKRRCLMEDNKCVPAKPLRQLRSGLMIAGSLCMFLVSALPSQAQLTTADVIGSVTDGSGAVVPNAHVVIVNLGTHETRSSQTASTGEY